MPKQHHMRRKRRRPTEYFKAIDELRQILSENIPQSHLIAGLKNSWQNSRRDFMAIDKRYPNWAVMVRIVRKKGAGSRVEMRFSVLESLYAWVFAGKPSLREAVDIGPQLPQDKGDPWQRYITRQSREELKFLAG